MYTADGAACISDLLICCNVPPKSTLSADLPPMKEVVSGALQPCHWALYLDLSVLQWATAAPSAVSQWWNSQLLTRCSKHGGWFWIKINPNHTSATTYIFQIIILFCCQLKLWNWVLSSFKGPTASLPLSTEVPVIKILLQGFNFPFYSTDFKKYWATLPTFPPYAIPIPNNIISSNSFYTVVFFKIV